MAFNLQNWYSTYTTIPSYTHINGTISIENRSKYTVQVYGCFFVFLQQPDFTGHQVRKGGQGGNFFKFERALGTTALTIQIWGYPNFLHNEWTLDHILRVKSALKSSNFFGCCPKYWRLKSRTPRRVKHHGLQCLHQRPSLCSASSSS